MKKNIFLKPLSLPLYNYKVHILYFIWQIIHMEYCVFLFLFCSFISGEHGPVSVAHDDCYHCVTTFLHGFKGFPSQTKGGGGTLFSLIMPALLR